MISTSPCSDLKQVGKHPMDLDRKDLSTAETGFHLNYRTRDLQASARSYRLQEVVVHSEVDRHQPVSRTYRSQRNCQSDSPIMDCSSWCPLGLIECSLRLQAGCCYRLLSCFVQGPDRQS